VIEVAEVFRRFADDYLAAHDAGEGRASLLPSHRRAITDILACRTEALGGCERRPKSALFCRHMNLRSQLPPIALSITGSHWRHGRPTCSGALSGQAPKPRSGAPKARGLTANARTELSFVWPRCAL
jgi:hypothetical protein